MSFVLDNSVTMHWAFSDGSPSEVSYAARVLDELDDTSAIVPVTWGLEVANVLARAERTGSFSTKFSNAFVQTLAGLDIQPDDATFIEALARTLQLARTYKLSAYDASYLELALRLRIPLATLDENLQKAAKKAGVKRI